MALVRSRSGFVRAWDSVEYALCPGASESGGDLDAWLAPFLGVMGRSTRSKWAPLYVRGLLSSDGPKSVQPIATRLGLPGHDQLHHLKGTTSVGVTGQYCGALGKQANCQCLVSLTLARGEVPVPVGLRLFLPSVWTDDPARCAKAGVPEAARIAQTKPEIALAEIDRVMASGVRFGCVLADAGYGNGAAFRRGLSACGLAWVGRCYPYVEGLHHWGGGLAVPTGEPRQSAPASCAE